MPSQKMPLLEQVNGGFIVTLGEEYDSLTGTVLDTVSESLHTMVEQINPPCLIFDLTHTSFFGSAFLEILVRTWNTLEKRGEGRMILCGLQPYCEEVLQVTHLNEIWELFPDRSSAIEALVNIV